MASWDDVLNSFKSQFEATGPERFANIGASADTSFALADRMMSTLAQGANQVSGIMATNVREAQTAAEANKKQGFKRVYNKVGGYDFLDPSGNKISPLEWSMAKGVSISDALQGSYDKGDINFLQDMDAMKVDLATGRMDFNQAIDLMSQDYPHIFGRQGIQGGEGVYEQERKRVGSELVGREYTGESAKGKYNQIIIDYANKARSFRNYDEAKAEIDNIQAGLGKHGWFKKALTKSEQKAIMEEIYKITDEIFVPRDSQAAIRNLPF